jgi:hypothetical protein
LGNKRSHQLQKSYEAALIEANRSAENGDGQTAQLN